MIRFNIHILCAILILLSSCTVKTFNTESHHNELNAWIDKDDFIIPDTMFDYYPQKTDGSWVTDDIITIRQCASTEIAQNRVEVGRYAPYSIYQWYQIKDTVVLDSIVDACRRLSKMVMKSEDTCYLAVDDLWRDFGTNKDMAYYTKPLVGLFKTNIDDKLANVGSWETNCGLCPNSELFLIKEGRIPVIDAQFLSNKTDIIFHGYSGGLANCPNNIIVFWTVVW